jgi:hypothetical protein
MIFHVSKQGSHGSSLTNCGSNELNDVCLTFLSFKEMAKNDRRKCCKNCLAAVNAFLKKYSEVFNEKFDPL